MIIKEYRCLDCGEQFESSDSDPSCPTCSGIEAEREFRTAPGYRSADTSFNDRTVRDLAEHHGLSDVSNKDGQAVQRPAATNVPAPSFTSNPALMQRITALGGAADNASPVLPMFRQAQRANPLGGKFRGRSQ